MNQKKIEGVLRKLARLDLTDLAERAIDDGEQTHKGNRDAIHAFIIEANDFKGLRAVKDMLAGVSSWDASLKEFENAAKKIARRANKALWGPEDIGLDEPNSQENGDSSKSGQGD